MAFGRKKETDKQSAGTPTADKSPKVRAVPPALEKVSYIIAIASGKGGVGKSTVSTNLAVALTSLGHSVALMDADIYGPSQPNMLGAAGSRADITEDNRLRPMNKFGVDFVSISLLMDEDQPVIWRAPIATKMIMQFIGAVEWGKKDFLLIDLPPGTGDVQLTLSQQASLTGAIIVTTPQHVALSVARKGLQMFEQVKVPTLGIIENMSGFTCSHCGKVTNVFSEGGGKALAESHKIPLLASIPLDPAVMMSGDSGQPVLHQDSDSIPSQRFLEAARKLVDIVGTADRDNDVPSAMEVAEDGRLAVTWADGDAVHYSPYDLRTNCVCAACVDEDTGRKTLDPTRVPLDITITGINPVGRYAVSISFSDGHNSGIYTYDRLRNLANLKKQSFKL